jgi:Uma2 family endonuclease
MNDHTRPPRHRTTTTADGLPRLSWSLAEFERLSELGFFGGVEGPRERVELVDGEILPMHAKGGRHEWVRSEIQKELLLRLGRDFSVYSEPGWRPGGDLYLEPELIVCRAGLKPSEVPPADVLLLIEVADSSLAYDTGLKARIYARLGIGEYWVVNARTLETLVHLHPQGEAFSDAKLVAADVMLAPTRLPAITFSLGSLGLA